MPSQIEPFYQLRDAQQRLLGQMTVERTETELLLGKFEAGPEFATVETLFRAFEEAVDCQALAVVEDYDAAIAALGLRLCLPDGSQCLAVQDVQIWSDGAMTCRLSGTPQAMGNGNWNAPSAVESVSRQRSDTP